MYTKSIKETGFPFTLDHGLPINQPPLRKNGRPTVVKNNAKTRKQISYLASHGISQKSAAAFLDVSRQALLNAFKRHPRLRAAWDSGTATCKVNLRAKQYQRAMAGSDRLLIWLGKQMLRQTDKPQSTQTKLPGEMNDDELRDYVLRLRQSLAASTDETEEQVDLNANDELEAKNT
jgi:hypothetical protein